MLNRWIIPLEKRYDLLRLASGRKIRVPFDQFVVFSTNLEPKDLVDEAFLRRIPYKIEIENPSEGQFRSLFQSMCGKLGLEFQDAAFDHLMTTHYRQPRREMRFCHPRDLLQQVRTYCRFLGLPQAASTMAPGYRGAELFFDRWRVSGELRLSHFQQAAVAAADDQPPPASGYRDQHRAGAQGTAGVGLAQLLAIGRGYPPDDTALRREIETSSAEEAPGQRAVFQVRLPRHLLPIFNGDEQLFVGRQEHELAYGRGPHAQCPPRAVDLPGDSSGSTKLNKLSSASAT